MSDYYTVSGAPATGSQGLSSIMRAEFALISTGFSKLPTYTANANKVVVVNSGGTGLTVTAGSLSLAGHLTLSGGFAVTLVAGADVSLTLPIVSGLTLATLTGTETLTNKTLTSPALSAPTFTGTYTLGGTPTVSAGLVLATGSSTARTLATRFDEMVNPYDYGAIGDGVTSDQTAVANATADAFAAGKQMYWPLGTFLTTASIPNFHSIRHFGPGIVKRGSTSFRVSPRSGQVNNLYVATTGNDANDGLTSSEPTLTIQKAVDALALYVPLQANWVINVAAGTYSEAVSVPPHTSFGDDYLEIKGPTPVAGTASGATTNAAGYAVNATVITLANAGTGTFIVGDTVQFATASTASGATTNAAGYAIGATVITLASAGTGSLVIGDYITFTDLRDTYRILAGDTDVSNGGTFTITPPLIEAISAAAQPIQVVKALHRITAGDTDVSNGGTITITPGLNQAIPASATAITQVTTNWAIPTVIIDVPGGGGTFAIDCTYHNRMKLSYLKATNWLAANNATGGLRMGDGGVLWTYNCHAFKCREGIIGDACQLYVQGGILTGVTWSTGAFPSGGGTNGVVAYSGTRISLGYGSTNEQTGTIIEHWLGSGYHGKSRTHCVSTWAVFKSNATGIFLYSNSRFDDRTNIFRKNALVMELEQSMHTSDQLGGARSDFNLGEAYTQAPDSNTIGTAAGATTNAAGYAIGVKTITLASAGTGTVVVGDRITFAGDTTEYRITSGDTDVSNGGSLFFSPGLLANIPAAATAITLVPTSGQGNFTLWKYELHSGFESASLPAALPTSVVNPIGCLDVGRARASTVMTGAIASTLARTLYTVPAGAFAVNSDGNYYEVHVVGAGAGAVGAAKTVLLVLNGITMATLTIATGTQAWSFRSEIWPTSNYAQVIAHTTALGGATVIEQRLAPIGMDAWADQALEVWVTVPGAADTVTIHESRVIKWG